MTFEQAISCGFTCGICPLSESFARDHLGAVGSSPDCSIAVAQLGREQPSMRSLEALREEKARTLIWISFDDIIIMRKTTVND